MDYVWWALGCETNEDVKKNKSATMIQRSYKLYLFNKLLKFPVLLSE